MVLTTGIATAILAKLIWAIEVRGVRGWWTRFFDVFGKNALFVFALSAFLPKGLRLIRIPNGVNASGQPTYLSPWNWWYEKVTKHLPGDPELGSLAFALTVILFYVGDLLLAGQKADLYQGVRATIGSSGKYYKDAFKHGY